MASFRCTPVLLFLYGGVGVGGDGGAGERIGKSGATFSGGAPGKIRLPVKQATASPSVAATAASSASWRRLLSLLLWVDQAADCVYLCCFFDGGWEDGGSRLIFGMAGGSIVFLPYFVGDGTRSVFLLPCERVETPCIPGDAPSVCFAALVSVVGLHVWSAAAADCASSSSLYVLMADILSASTMRPGLVRRWLMRRFHAVELVVEEEGGFIFARVLVAGGQKLWSQELRWGAVLQFSVHPGCFM